MLRPMSFAHFYAGDCAAAIEGFLEGFAEEGGEGEEAAARAAFVPHAGWRYSGRVAARTLKLLSLSRPESLILFGAVHRLRLQRAALYPEGSWETPLGNVAVDADIGRELLASLPDRLEAAPDVHLDEHAIEVLMPFIRAFFPEARIVPILVPPDERAADLGARIAQILGAQPVAAIASTDLTHYGLPYGFLPAGTGERAHAWMRANDRRMIERALRLEAEALVGEARRRRNACGPGALAAAVAFARACGRRRGILVERTDSHDVSRSEGPFEMAVGYAGALY